MSRYGRSIDPLRGSGVSRSLAAPGVAPIPVIPDQTANQVAGIVGESLRATSAVVDFMTGAERIRIAQEREAAFRNQQAMLQAERENQDTLKMQEGLGADRANLLAPTIQQRVASGEFGTPETDDPQDVIQWAESVGTTIAAQAGADATPATLQAFVRPASNIAIDAYAGERARVVAEDTAETKRAAISGSQAQGGPGVSLLTDTAERLGLDAPKAYADIYLPAARLAAQRGRTALNEYSELLSVPEYAAERQILESQADDADYNRWSRMGSILNQQRVELERDERAATAQTTAMLEGFRDRFANQIAFAKNVDDFRKAETFVLDAIKNNPQFSDELVGMAQQAKSRIADFVEAEQLRIANGRIAGRVEQATAASTRAIYAGAGWAVENEPIEVSEQLPSGQVITRKVSQNERMTASMDAVAQQVFAEEFDTVASGQPGVPEQVLQQQASQRALPRLAQMFGKMSPKYAPWESLLRAGASVGEITVTADGKTQVPPTAIEAVRVYESLKLGDPTTAAKYAGDNAPWYESVLEKKREPGIGNDTAKAIAEADRARRSPRADVKELNAAQLKSAAMEIEGVVDANYLNLTPVIRAEYERLARGGVPADIALTRAKELAKARVAVVNGQVVHSGNRILPPGPYGSFQKSAEAAIELLASANPEIGSGEDRLDWKRVSIALDQDTGRVFLQNSDNLLPVQVEGGPQSLEDLTMLAIRAKRAGIVAASMPSKLTPMQQAYYDGKGIDRQAIRNAPGPTRLVGDAATGAANAALDFGRWWDARVARPTLPQGTR